MGLTNAFLKNLPLGKSLCDGSNLYFKKTGPETGKWSFRFQFQGKSHEMGLGVYPYVSISDARQKARDAHHKLYQGINPLLARRAAESERKRRADVKFSHIAEKYIQNHQSDWTNAKHAHDWASTLRRFAYPTLDLKPLADLTTEDVIQVLEPIWNVKRETARKLQSRIKRVFGFAKARELYRGPNPALWDDHLSHYFPGHNARRVIKHHRSLDYRQAPAFYRELRKIETMASSALQFALLTAARTTETIGTQRQEIDLIKGLWHVPAERMKARRPHTVPLSIQACNLLKRVMRSHNADCVFPGQKPGRYLSNMAMLTLTKKRLGSYDTTVHGLRSTFRTWAGEETNYNPGVIEFALAHQLNRKVEGAYLRVSLVEPRRGLMQDWADFVDGSRPSENLERVVLN